MRISIDINVPSGYRLTSTKVEIIQPGKEYLRQLNGDGAWVVKRLALDAPALFKAYPVEKVEQKSVIQ